MRQLLTERALLGLLGGACGVAVAMGCVRLVPLLLHERLPGLLEQTRVDGAVLGFTIAVSLVTGLIFGLAPALASIRGDVFPTLKEGGRTGTGGGRRRVWNLLVVTETALALVLAIGATLLVRTFFYLRDVAPGFRVDTLLTARVTPPPRKFTTREQCIAYWKEIVERVRAIPEVEAATFAQNLPMGGDNTVGIWPVEGQSPRLEDYPTMWIRVVDPDYFRALQIPARRGRMFTERDDASAPKVVVVNDAFARRFFAGGDPVGKHVGGGGDAPLHEIIGVVGDVRAENSIKAAPIELYFPFLQSPPGHIALAVRTHPRMYRSPLLLAPAIERAVAAVDRDQKLTHVAEMQRLVSDRIAPKRLSAQLIAIFASLALVLAAVGTYGLLSFSVAQRTHEIGIRVALGADRSRVLRMVVGEAAILVAAGCAAGTAAALGLTRILRTLLFGVSATDPWVYAGACATLLAMGITAAVVPAFRAAAVDPLEALRQE